ncbi:MAG: flagellar regulator YcgR PilZN domain-containing protein [Betaproteobacteria bacterium]
MSADDARAGAGGGERDDRYRIESPLEIAALLNEVAARGALVSVTFGNDVVMTVLLRADAAAGALVFDAGSDLEANLRLGVARRLGFETHLDRIRIVFYTAGAIAQTWDGAPAFAVALPPSVLRMQRRDYFRAHVPLTRGIRCELQPEVAATGDAATLRVLDMSVTGVALVDGPPGFEPAPGSVLKAVTLALPPGPVTVDLEVMYRKENPRGSGGSGPLVRFGCRFVNLPAQCETLIQRCINQLERERRATQ